jgi:hypothetical protein
MVLGCIMWHHVLIFPVKFQLHHDVIYDATIYGNDRVTSFFALTTTLAYRVRDVIAMGGVIYICAVSDTWRDPPLSVWLTLFRVQ